MTDRNFISQRARDLQNSTRELSLNKQLPKGDDSMVGKPSACCSAKLVSSFIGEAQKQQVIFCSKCGRKFYRLVDKDHISMF